MREMPIWLDYAEFDDDGLCGISPNAPDEVKKAYEDYLELKKKRLNQKA